MPKHEMYKRRLLYCIEKARTDKENSCYWMIAVDVYKHLIDCKKNHTITYNGQCSCTFGS